MLSNPSARATTKRKATRGDFAIPAKLSSEAKRAATTIVSTMRRYLGNEPDGGGSRAFHAQHESCGDAVLVVVHDGGDATIFFNYDYENYEAIEAMNKALKKIGLYAESCTSWSTGIYRI